MARALAYEVDGELWPVALEVRLKAAPCWHDEPPADLDPHITWERQDVCDCWPSQPWPGTDAVPAGGLPLRALRRLKLTELSANYRAAVTNRAHYTGTDHPRPEVAGHFRAILDGPERPPARRGRPRLDPARRLARLSALDSAYAAGKTQTAAARALGISPATLRTTLEWARRQTPPLWTRSGRGRPGRLTAAGRQLIAYQKDAQ